MTVLSLEMPPTGTGVAHDSVRLQPIPASRSDDSFSKAAGSLAPSDASPYWLGWLPRSTGSVCSDGRRAAGTAAARSRPTPRPTCAASRGGAEVPQPRLLRTAQRGSLGRYGRSHLGTKARDPARSAGAHGRRTGTRLARLLLPLGRSAHEAHPDAPGRGHRPGTCKHPERERRFRSASVRRLRRLRQRRVARQDRTATQPRPQRQLRRAGAGQRPPAGTGAERTGGRTAATVHTRPEAVGHRVPRRHRPGRHRAPGPGPAEAPAGARGRGAAGATAGPAGRAGAAAGGRPPGRVRRA